MLSLSGLTPQVRQYLLITGNYWAFTLTDGALRMLVVLYFHQLGYSPLAIAFLFLFYEIFGVVTNLFGGWLGARFGLNKTMNIGLGIQLIALLMLLVPMSLLTVPWVMAAQALSGVAKDLNKMSAKSAIKFLVPEDNQSSLYKWVAMLTGSKNALKGAGFFLGGALLSLLGFQEAIWVLLIGLSVVWGASLVFLAQDLGRAKTKPKINQILSSSRAINYLSAARMFLFGARDVWFVVALPVYLSSVFGWDHWWVGGFIAVWVIGYGFTQSLAPTVTRKCSGGVPTGQDAKLWVWVLLFIPATIAALLYLQLAPMVSLVGGLLVFGVVFAVNSSLHSYLIVSYARGDGTSLDVGFYYMANAAGRLIGTLLSGALYQYGGLELCLLVSTLFLIITAVISAKLPLHS